MIDSQISDLIKYRIGRADETLLEAKLMAKTEHWNTSISRLYYACFYIVNALLIKHNLSSAKHTGVKSIFNKDFVHKGFVPVSISEIYNDLFDLRHESDYEDFFQADRELVTSMIPQVESFLDCIKGLI